MQKIIMVETPKGSMFALDLENLKTAKAKKDGAIIIEYNDDSYDTIAKTKEYSEEKMKMILEGMIDAKNKYEDFLLNVSMKKEAMEIAIKEAMEIATEAIQSTGLSAVAKEAEKTLALLKEASLENVKIQKELSESKEEVNKLTKNVSNLASEIERLTSIVFQG